VAGWATADSRQLLPAREERRPKGFERHFTSTPDFGVEPATKWIESRKDRLFCFLQ
jgi:hypothetical protein